MRSWIYVCLATFVSVLAGVLEQPSLVPIVIESRVSAAADDAEETSTGFMYVNSSDIELVYDGGEQTVGLRFRDLGVPQGATITRAYVQFQVNETGSERTSLSIRGEAADHAQPFSTAADDISARPSTAGAVSWSPVAWPVIGMAGLDQRTPDLSTIVQEVVSRPGWSAGHALAFLISGEGRRTAESYEGLPAAAPLLVVEYTADASGGNQRPIVSAGPDGSVLLPGVAQLDGSVSDDGLPDPPGAVATRWSQEGGPQAVVLADPLSLRTTVSFSAPGTYTLRLTADDGAAASSDDVVITVQGATSGITAVDARVAAASDDAEESLSSGAVITSSTDLELIYDGGNQIAGVRFTGLAIPQGASIREAWLQFQTDEATSGATVLLIRGEAVDRAAAFSSSSQNLSARALTTAGVNWSPAPWNLIGEAGASQRTPDLSAVVQEIVSRPGWASGSAMSFLITGSGKRVAVAYDGSSSGAARLHVGYATGSGGSGGGGGGGGTGGGGGASGTADEVHWTILGQNAVTLDWRGSATLVRYGTAPGVLGSSAIGLTPSPLPDSSAGPFWEARLTGLRENTLYYYAIGDGPESTFRTPPPRGTSDFWVAMQADIGSVARYPGVGPTQAQIASDNPNIPGDERPRFVMVAGDLTYGDQNGTAEVDNHFNDMMPWSRWAAYMPAWGNHEDGSSADDRQNYEGRFDFPNSQDVPNPPPAGGPGEEWMWFDYGNLRVITYPEPFSGAWSDWQAKADAIMAQAQADPVITFILTYGHRPPYSSGSDHGGESIAGNIAALKAKHSKYVLNLAGHTHHYERTDPAQTGGMLHIISGGAGASLGGLDSTQPSWSVFRMNHFVNVRIHVTANRIDGYAVCGSSGGGASDSCLQGSIVDTWSIVSGTSGANRPPDSLIDSPTGAVRIQAGQSVAFAGTGVDPDGNFPLTYRWSFGGGAANSSAQDPGSVTFAAPGTYTVTFTVTDSLGLADPTPATRTVTVQAITGNLPPDGTIDSPASPVTIQPGQSVTFAGSGSDPDGNLPLTYRWSFGGGAANSSAQDPGAVTFATAGVYTVTFTVTDSLGLSDPTPATRVVTVTPVTTAACTDYVSPTGSDNNAGTLSAPWRTVTFALGRLAPGDTLCLRGGTYYERPSVTASGTASARIVIQSFPGERAILDSGGPEFRTPGNSDWELVNAALGEYRSVKTFSSGNIYAYVTGISGYQNERVGLAPYTSASAFRSTSDQYVDSSTQFYVGPGTFRDSDSRIHIRLSKTQDMRDMEARYGQVFPVDNADPRSYGIVLSNASSTLAVQASYVTIKDLTVHQALQTITLAGGVHDVTFDGITAWHGDRTISVGGSGVYNITVVNSRLYGDVPTWIAWSDAKSSPAPVNLWRGTTVNLNSGARDVRISYSHLRGGHDGIGTNTSESNITIDHNRIENFADDCMELEGTTSVGKISVYENYLGNCLVAIAPGQDTPSFPGPLLVYRNVVVLLRNAYVNRKSGINSWNGGGRFGYEYMFKHGTGSSYSTRNAHYYHNTLVMLNSSGKGINITPKYTSDVRIANNLMIMVNGVVNGAYRTAAGMVWNGDLYWKMNTVDSAHLLSSYDTVSAFSSATGFESGGIGSTSRRGTNPQFATFIPNVVDRAQSVWALRADSESFKPSGFVLAVGSPAIGSGIVIPAHPVLGTLPDTRVSRDIGAIPFGTPASEYDIFPFNAGGR